MSDTGAVYRCLIRIECTQRTVRLGGSFISNSSGKLLAPVHTCDRFWPDLGNSEVIHWTKNVLSLEVIDLAS